MYRIYCDGVCFYNDAYALDAQRVISPILEMEDNAAGSLDFTLSPENIAYDLINKMSSEIVVYRDDEVMWAGRMVSGSTDFWNRRKFFCEGELAFLNDTIQPPAEYHNLTPKQYLETLVSIHNTKAGEDKQFVVGEVTVTDSNDSIYRYTNYESTLECITEDLIDSLGGHLRVRREGPVRYLDYLADYQNNGAQEIHFGENLIEYTSSFDMAELATVIIPTGERLDSSPIAALDAYLTVASVNDGSIYVENESAVERFGRVEARVEWPDVTTASVLLTKAQEWLSDVQFDKIVLEMNAVDLHLLNPDIGALNVLDNVRCVSTPHGMDRYFPVTKITLYLDQPNKNKYVLGDGKPVTLTSLSSTRSSERALTTTQVSNIASGEARSVIASSLYPVGSIYMSINNTDPSTLFGGIWEQIEDTFLLAAGSTYTAGATGGEATHTLTVNEMPTHKHSLAFGGADVSGATWNIKDHQQTAYTGSNFYRDGGYVQNTGGGQAHNNMPPYLVVYVWKRVA